MFAQAFNDFTTTTNTTTQVDEGVLAAMITFLLGIMLFLIPLLIFYIITLWKTFEKAGVEGWKAIIPVYNGWVLAEIAGKPGWWALVGLLGAIPILGWIASIVALVLYIIIAIELAKSFGKEPVFALLLILLPIIGFAILAFGSAKYKGPGGIAKSTPATGGDTTAPKTTTS